MDLALQSNWRLVVPCAVLGATGLYVFVSNARFALKYKGKKLPPVYKGGFQLPILGAVTQFLWDPLAMARRAEAEVGDIFTVIICGQRLTFMSGPEAQEKFCKANDDQLSQQEAYRFSVPLFGEGVVYDADMPTRKEQFKFVTNSLHTTALNQYVPQMVEEAEQYFAQWGPSGEVDIYKALSELIIQTASRCLMGAEIRGRLFKEVSELYATLDKGCLPVSFFAPYLPIPAHWNRDKARAQMVKLFQGIIEERRRENRKGDDVLQVFMDATYTNEGRRGQRLSTNEVTGLMIALLFAGQHTSSVTSSWTGLYLLHHTHLLPELLEEQKKAGALDGNSIRGMQLLHGCVSEALRLQPPLIFVMRKVLKQEKPNQEFQFNGYTVPEGDIIFVSPSLAGRRKEVWSNPDAYDPHRFLEPRIEHHPKAYPNAWLGFGGGRHRCIGENFAYMQIKTIWSYLLRNFEMEAVGELPKPNYEALVVGPTPPCIIKYKRRATPLC
mmetsp:Transcript_39593/g.81072  ORF Transcript_39593/g.81072 Transcript_39593/m.81072 type:complete len:496 (+) Transcript_39593:40-1527(+)